MLDLARLRSIRLQRRPLTQRLAAELIIWLDYWNFHRTQVVIEGLERIPRDRSVFIAMNHPDRFNYFPFLVKMHREHQRYCATWVKGKYYESRLTGAFMDLTNQLPLPSWGYLLSSRFRHVLGRRPSTEAYELLKRLSEGAPLQEQARRALGDDLDRLVAHFGGPDLATGMARTYRELMQEVVRLNRAAVEEHDLHVLVFPQGTRSLRLSRGHTGLAQVACALGRDIVPVGCNGSEKLYPGDSPLSRGGRVVYRVGEPLRWDGPALGPHRVDEPYVPLTREASQRHGQRFQAATDVVMDRINDLLDPEYQYAPGLESDGVQGVDRFI